MLTALLFAMIVSPQRDPGAPPPGAVVLFGGSDTSEWVMTGTNAPCLWNVQNGEMIVNTSASNIVTKRSFGSYRLHLEFCLPLMPNAKDQGRANSGVYNHGRYEIQILDSYNNPTYKFGGCGALYGQKDPDTDAIKPPENWNTYDILFESPKFDSLGTLTARPRISVWHNGIRIHRDVQIDKNATTAGLEGPLSPKGPIMLQNHGSLIRFRTIWIVETGD
jgi:hypothetical protein